MGCKAPEEEDLTEREARLVRKIFTMMDRDQEGIILFNTLKEAFDDNVEKTATFFEECGAKDEIKIDIERLFYYFRRKKYIEKKELEASKELRVSQPRATASEVPNSKSEFFNATVRAFYARAKRVYKPPEPLPR